MTLSVYTFNKVYKSVWTIFSIFVTAMSNVNKVLGPRPGTSLQQKHCHAICQVLPYYRKFTIRGHVTGK